MKIGIVGSGYVGTTMAAQFADLGHDVMIVDDDGSVVTRLNDGEPPVTEPDLAEAVERHAGDRLWATEDYDDVADADVLFFALSDRDDADVESVAAAVGRVLADAEGYPTVVLTRPVVPGTADEVVGPILEREAGEGVGLAVNPVFLRRGSAVADAADPDRLVFGADDDRAADALDAAYGPMLDDEVPVVRTGRREAETIKHATSAVLAARAGLVDDLGALCREHGVDPEAVAGAVGLDDRVDAGILQGDDEWGAGRAGSDASALADAADHDPDLAVLSAAGGVNDRGPRRMLARLDDHLDVEGERVAVLGLASTPETDGVRDGAAIPVIDGLLDRGANVVAYDPVANDALRGRFPEVEFLASPSPTLSGASAALVITAWPAFADLDLEFDLMSGSVVIDGPGVVTRREGITYEGLTW